MKPAASPTVGNAARSSDHSNNSFQNPAYGIRIQRYFYVEDSATNCYRDLSVALSDKGWQKTNYKKNSLVTKKR